MRLQDIDEMTTLYKYDWVGENPMRYELCQYILDTHIIDSTGQSVNLLNLMTDKISIVGQYHLDNEYYEYEKDAHLKAIKFYAELNDQAMKDINNHNQIIKNLVDKYL